VQRDDTGVTDVHELGAPGGGVDLLCPLGQELVDEVPPDPSIGTGHQCDGPVDLHARPFDVVRAQVAVREKR
jgi:hypothetical protein